MNPLVFCIKCDREDLGMAYKYARREGAGEFELCRLRRVLKSLRIFHRYLEATT